MGSEIERGRRGTWIWIAARRGLLRCGAEEGTCETARRWQIGYVTTRMGGKERRGGVEQLMP
jgi:hypothetical protein